MGNHRLWGRQGCAYEEVVHVPLLVWLPGRRQGRVSDARLSPVDAMSAVLSATEVTGPEMEGRDLHQSLQDGGYGGAFAEANGFIGATDGR